MPLVKKPIPDKDDDQFAKIMMWTYIVLVVAFAVMWFVVPLIVK